MEARHFVLGLLVLLPPILSPAATPDTGSKFKVLYNFRGGSNGQNPILFAALAIDAREDLYGATYRGGTGCGGEGCGVIFEAARGGAGKWSESVLFDITDPRTQGFFDSPLTLDSQGNLYGCTASGPMFELTPQPTTQWTFDPIWSYGCGGPVGLILDAAGDLYGAFGNDNSAGVSQLSRTSKGWVYANLHEFCKQRGCPDGQDPLAPFSWDANGNLYGTTYFGGYPYPGCNCGVAFQMTPKGHGAWTYRVMHRFSYGKDGGYPGSGLTVDASGNAYGTAIYAGPYGNGDVFRLTPSSGGRWKLTVLYGFPNGTDGAAPVGNLVFDKAGNLYGIAGSSNCNWTCGLVFKLSPQKNGRWKYSVVHRFNMTDGDFPNGLTMDSQGHLYGSTMNGGKYGYGVVFEITP